MAGPNQRRVRIGVVGLGRLWEARHKPALAKMKDRFQVVAVYDQVARRAEIEAGQLGCRAAEGLVELIDRPDVDAVYLLTPQWFGLHPLELACDLGKPVYCALPLAGQDEDLARVDALVRSSGVLFMPEFARRSYPTTLRLKELLETRLGPPRMVVGHGRLAGFDRYGQPGPSTQIAPASLLVDPGSYLIDWCRHVFEAEPTAVQGWTGSILPGVDGPGPDYLTYLLEFGAAGSAQLSTGRYHRAAWGEASRFLPQPGLQVFAERGVAWLEMPDRIHWTDAEGVHEERLPLEPTVGELLNEQFHRLVRGDRPMTPNWADALAVARLIETVKRSAREGRRIEATPA